MYKPSDYVEPDVEVWNENWEVLDFFRTYSSQWRVAANGPVGFDYNILHHYLNRKKIEGDAFEQYIHDFRVVEMAALTNIHKR